MIDERLEWPRLAGKFTLLLAGGYALLITKILIQTSTGSHMGPLDWLLLTLPAPAFTPAAITAIRLHRTTNPDTAAMLSRWSLLLAGIGTKDLILGTIFLLRITS